ncbi:MAG: hypothetical protein A2219_08855 [Elusimicrobia bacterium RIFOXYA2_FULL_50_26]|nr:MAG: hypothetical protein A2219_08855 [Elusimicrobia bacterium RIFOXYA2_FULL_50_26]OGS24174.1 MAG: hypothetical protein A2314_01850 [Elusimicrobia bacterium RIFOXYB2_FULL_50_12]
MASIRILSDETINKIAAGEVIERPANAVKELIENALDAGGRRIDIQIRGAGRKFIRIKDDGSGMSREDIALAVTRHATSKITQFDDLSSLGTLGFRGEALPSIAAVSHLQIFSQQSGAESGWSILFVGGKIMNSRAWAGAAGTIIELTDLFFNTPARAKFLKSDSCERTHILRTIEELALAYPATSFTVTSEGKTALNAPAAATIRERISDVLGTSLARQLTPVNAAHPQVRLEGFVTKTENSRPARNEQFLFINKRPVHLGKLLTHALYDAYRENLPSGRHPGVVLFMELNPAEIDVNIHPTKREVRFSKEQEIHQFVYRAIRTAITQPVAISLSAPYELAPAPPPAAMNETRKAYAAQNNFTAAPPQPHLSTQQEFNAISGDEHYVKVLGQSFASFIVAQKGDDFIIVDQHAAAERIRYENYVAQWQKKQIAVQGLLIPTTLELPSSKTALLAASITLFSEAGWDITEFGSNTFRISALPAALGTDTETENLISASLDALAAESALPPAQKIELIIRSACKASIKARDSLSIPEMEQLLKTLFTCHSPYTCPHGRPTILKLSREELKKHFGRR